MRSRKSDVQKVQPGWTAAKEPCPKIVAASAPIPEDEAPRGITNQNIQL